MKGLREGRRDRRTLYHHGNTFSSGTDAEQRIPKALPRSCFFFDPPVSAAGEGRCVCARARVKANET
jgi:hypothetical protein